MAKSKALIAAEANNAALTAQLAELTSANAALEARLAIARTSYRAQRDTIAELESKLNTRGCIATDADAADAAVYALLNDVRVQPARKPETVISRFTKRDGSVWERARTGNCSIIRELLVHA